MARQLEERMYRILSAQAANLARIETDLELPGTDANGEAVKLWGPQPDIIRLYDTPLSFVQSDLLKGADTIITLMPALDDDPGAIVGRVDSSFSYLIYLWVKLTQREQEEDRQAVFADGLKGAGGGGVVNPLALKMHRLLFDLHAVFYERLLLPTDDCPGGLVDDQRKRTSWIHDVTYPASMCVVTVTGTTGGW